MARPQYGPVRYAETTDTYPPDYDGPVAVRDRPISNQLDSIYAVMEHVGDSISRLTERIESVCSPYKGAVERDEQKATVERSTSEVMARLTVIHERLQVFDFQLDDLSRRVEL